MSIALPLRADEGSTYQIEDIQFLDEESTPVLPNSDPTWSLCKDDGTAIDSGTLTAGLTMSLVLSGDQLTVSADELKEYNTVNGAKVYYVKRRVKISGFVDSTLGNDRPVKQEFIFIIDNITCEE